MEDFEEERGHGEEDDPVLSHLMYPDDPQYKEYGGPVYERSRTGYRPVGNAKLSVVDRLFGGCVMLLLMGGAVGLVALILWLLR